jgi:hypothetical protein
MSYQGNRVYGYYNARCGLGPAYFVDYLKGNACRPSLEYYYKLYLDDGADAYTSTQITTDNSSYAGIVNTYSTSSDYTTFNTANLFTFNGIKNPSATIEGGITIPSTYYEIITLQTEPYNTNIIEGSVNYIDESSSLETSVPVLNVNVSVAKGIFEGYSKMTLYLDNTDPRYTRKVIIS